MIYLNMVITWGQFCLVIFAFHCGILSIEIRVNRFRCLMIILTLLRFATLVRHNIITLLPSVPFTRIKKKLIVTIQEFKYTLLLKQTNHFLFSSWILYIETFIDWEIYRIVLHWKKFWKMTFWYKNFLIYFYFEFDFFGLVFLFKNLLLRMESL